MIFRHHLRSWPSLCWRQRAHIPIALAAAVLLALSVLLIINILHRPPLNLHIPALDGYDPPANPVPLSWRHVRDGSFQKRYAHRLAAAEPLFPLAVRLRDQFDYSVLAFAGNPHLLVGRGSVLLETAFATEYCSRDLARFAQYAPAWAAKIRAMQDAAAAHGTYFLYLLTPSKVALYPADLPAWYACPAAASDRRKIVPAWLDILRRHGVHIADARDAVIAAEQNYPFAMFPHGGTHWNAVGAAIGTQALIAALDREAGGAKIPPFRFTYSMSRHPAGADIDLALLLNQFFAPTDYEVPTLSLTQARPAGTCPLTRMVVVGGSFFEGIGATLSRLPCHPRVVEYWYWKIHKSVWENGALTVSPIDPAQRDRDLRQADLIVYEEDEQLLLHSKHGPKLYEWLMAWEGR